MVSPFQEVLSLALSRRRVSCSLYAQGSKKVRSKWILSRKMNISSDTNASFRLYLCSSHPSMCLIRHRHPDIRSRAASPATFLSTLQRLASRRTLSQSSSPELIVVSLQLSEVLAVATASVLRPSGLIPSERNFSKYAFGCSLRNSDGDSADGAVGTAIVSRVRDGRSTV